MGGKPRPFRFHCWPVLEHEGMRPVISDGFERPGPSAKRGGRGHLGLDVMFRRLKRGKFNRPEFTPWFYCPSDVVQAVAVAPGKVWSVRWSPKNGGVVKVSHGRRWLAVYRHLSRIDVEAGQAVKPSEVVGILGHAPSAGKRGINHLHFELWDCARPGRNSRANRSVNPERWLRS